MYVYVGASQVALVVKDLPANAGDASLIPRLGSSPREEHSNSLQYYCLENPMDRGAWQATVHRVTQSRTRLKQLSMHAMHVYVYFYAFTHVYMHIYSHIYCM